MKHARIILFFVISVLFIQCSKKIVPLGKEHPVKYLTVTSNEAVIQKLYDSLQLPLLIVNTKVFLLSSECFFRDLGANANDRNSGGNANDRNAGGNANDRNAGGNANDRNAGGNANDRNAGGNANDRNAGGNANDRNAGGNANDRNAGGNANDRNLGGNVNNRNEGGGFANFSCGNDAKGTLLIYFHNANIDKTVKIYYNNKFYTIKNNFFKLKKS